MSVQEELLPLLETANSEEADVVTVEGELEIARQAETAARNALTQAQEATEEKSTTLGTEKNEYKAALIALRDAVDSRIAAL